VRCEVRRERGSEMRQCDVSKYLLEKLEEFHNQSQTCYNLQRANAALLDHQNRSREKFEKQQKEMESYKTKWMHIMMRR
jgi:hypothetical protein